MREEHICTYIIESIDHTVILFHKRRINICTFQPCLPCVSFYCSDMFDYQVSTSCVLRMRSGTIGIHSWRHGCVACNREASFWCVPDTTIPIVPAVTLICVFFDFTGPPFTHPTIPHRAHYIGHSTPRSSPSHYLAAIQALIHTYRMDVQYAYKETSGNDDISDEEDTWDGLQKEANDLLDSFVPLVVNTQGWIKGLGGDLLRKIEEIVEATDIFHLDSHGASFPPQRNQHIHLSDTRIHVIRPISSSPLAAYYTPADYRSLSILSYFHSIFPPRGREVRGWSTELPLCARAPWQVDCKEAIKRFVLVGAGFEDVVPDELEYALNCGIVALTCDEDPVMDTPLSDGREPSWPYIQGAPAPSPSTSHCVGLALIRGVHATTQTLHILTPVSPSLSSKCHVLVKGELELPVWGFLDYREGHGDGVAGVKWGKVPYLQMGGGEPGAIGGARRRVRKNLMRRGQIP